MTTREVVLHYLERVQSKDGWEDLLSDDLQFSNCTHPVRRTSGKQASLEGIGHFYAMATALEIERVIVEGQQACVLTRYDLNPPVGPSFESHIAEIFQVEHGKITSFAIYFDSAPYPRPASPAA